MVVRLRTVFALVTVLTLFWTVGQGQSKHKWREEQKDYYKKWLEEDVVYIITEEEEKVFKALNTDDEKEQFIEQFWYRRDPDLTTSANEYKEEHYRRIAYSNDRFTSGLPGWMMDRGRVYIVNGPPDGVESNPTGGLYSRPVHEGGGSTSTYPFEVWRYRYLEGIGTDVEVEFVDPTRSGEYRLAISSEEKDALLLVPGSGLTWSEELGLTSKHDRPFFSPGIAKTDPFRGGRAKDNPFDRYETYIRIQAPKPIKYRDLKEIVNVKVGYDNLSFKSRQDSFRLNDQQLLVPITLEFENKNLTFTQEQGLRVARLAVYGMVTSIANRVVREFEDDITTSYPAEEFGLRSTGHSLYQKIILLDKRMRYKVDLVVKDLNTGNLGTGRFAIIPPAYSQEKLSVSSLILSDSIRELGTIPAEDQMFVLGDVWVQPRPGRTFPVGQSLGAYFQIYNAGSDQTTLAPSLRVIYKIIDDSNGVLEVIDKTGDSIQFYSGQRVVLIQSLPTESLAPGSYKVEIEVYDEIEDQVAVITESFKLLPAGQGKQKKK